MTDVGRIIQARLDDLDWSQGRLSREMAARGRPVSTGNVSRWISGRHGPSTEYAVTLAEVLDINPKLLVSRGEAA